MSYNRSKDVEKRWWVKLWTNDWLSGSLRFDMTPIQRSIFLDLIALANESRDRGFIRANPNRPYPHSWIASKLNVSLEEFEEALAVCIAQDRVIENSDGIQVVNFQFYQNVKGAKHREGVGKEQPSTKYKPVN